MFYMAKKKQVNIVELLEADCLNAGTNISQICHIAGVDRSVLVRWKQREPKSLQTLHKLQTAINVAKKEAEKEKVPHV